MDENPAPATDPAVPAPDLGVPAEPAAQVEGPADAPAAPEAPAEETPPAAV